MNALYRRSRTGLYLFVSGDTSVKKVSTRADRPSDRLAEALVDREFVLRADFELLDNDGCTSISMRFLRGPRPPQPGEVVYLLDYDGHGCVGIVERIDGWYACVRPDWSTWTGDSAPPTAAPTPRKGPDPVVGRGTPGIQPH